MLSCENIKTPVLVMSSSQYIQVHMIVIIILLLDEKSSV